MTDQGTADYRSAGQEEAPNGWAAGFILFAGLMMIMTGGFQAFAGLVGLFEDEFYVTTPNYLLEFDATTWGWIHLLLGVVVLLAGLAVLAGQIWGRVIGIILAIVSALVNFAFIPFYPFWAITLITLNVFVIWALAAHGRELAA